MKGNGVSVTNDRLVRSLNIIDGPERERSRLVKRAVPHDSRDLTELYPTLGQHALVRKLGEYTVLFDAVSDRVMKISSFIAPILEQCDGTLDFAALDTMARHPELNLQTADLMHFFERLQTLGVLQLRTRKRKQAARILLVNPPLPFPRSRYAYQNVYPPLGLMYLAGQLIPEGFHVEILDMALEDMSPAALSAWLSDHREPWDLIGISLNMTCSAERAERTARNIRDVLPDVPIVMGGNHVTMTYSEVLKSGICDFVCLGASERTLTELCCAFFHKEGELRDVHGLAYMRQGAIERTSPVRVSKVIKEVYFPAYHLLPLDRYDIHNRVPIITSTGCPYDCRYCSTVKFNGRRVSYFAADRVISDIKRLMKEHGYSGFNFMDDAFTFNRKRITEICQRIIDEKLDIEWTCNTRVDMVSPELLQIMARAGCIGIFFGIESTDEVVLQRIRKRVDVEQIRNAVGWARAAGIKVRQSFIVGLPGDNDETLAGIRSFVEETEPDEVQISMLTLYPGTEMAEQPESFGLKIHPRRWEEYNINLPHASTDTMSCDEILNSYLDMRLALAEMAS